MDQNLKFLFGSLYAGEITTNEFLDKYFGGQEPSDEYVLNLITKAMTSKNDEVVEEIVVLLSTGAFSIPIFIEDLGILLLEPWHTKHEDITFLLDDAVDNFIIEQLYQATRLELDYLSYDSTFQLARKCIKLLSKINNEKSIDMLKEILKDENNVISGYAKKELERKRLL